MDEDTYETINCNIINYEELNPKIKKLYIYAIIVWIIAIILLRMYTTNFMGIFILLIPIAVFVFNYFYSYQCTETENFMLKGNYLSFAFLVSSVVIAWKPGGNKDIYPMMSIAIIFMLLSLVDLWVCKENIIILKHFRIICNTIALTLLCYIIVYFYGNRTK